MAHQPEPPVHTTANRHHYKTTGASRAQVRYWRAYLRFKDALVNVGVGLHNYVLRPCSLFLLPKAEWCVCALCSESDDRIHSKASQLHYSTRPQNTRYNPRAATPLPLNLAEMMDLLLTVHGHQILFDGCFNGDPHPGAFTYVVGMGCV